MPSRLPRSKFTFKNKIVVNGDRMLILSTCDVCGARKKCSTFDGSLEKWERSHRCGSDSYGAFSPRHPKICPHGFHAHRERRIMR